jgi:hypothetical protein
MNSANFAFAEFYEVRQKGLLGNSTAEVLKVKKVEALKKLKLLQPC